MTMAASPTASGPRSTSFLRPDGQLLAQSFMDYLLPSSYEVPEIEIIHHDAVARTVLGRRAPADLAISARRQRSRVPSTTRYGRSGSSTACR
jgi:hypothetical protein